MLLRLSPRLPRFIRTARLAGAELPLQRISFHRHQASRQVRPAVVRAARETGWVALLDRTWSLHRLPQVSPAAPALVLGPHPLRQRWVFRMLSRPRQRLRATAAARAALAEERALQVAHCWPTISFRLHLLLVVARQQLAAVRVVEAQVSGRRWMRAANLAPPASGGSGTNAGAVISTQPGSKVGLPSSGGTGSLAMSPSGGDKPGLGGAGGGTSIGHGEGSGSGMNGAGSGAGKSGAGVGSDASARSGISPSPGPGGSGNAPSGNPAVRGIDISGGSSQVTIPAFGSDPAASDPQSPRHSSLKQRQSFDVDVVATASSGGAFEPYKNLLHGETHTIYPDTSSSLGTAVMEYSEESVRDRGVLTPPQPIRTTLPEGLARARMVVICTLDASGNLKNIRVLEPGPAEMTAKVLAALNSWKFRAALRGDQPVEVTAIVGFGIDTNDRF